VRFSPHIPWLLASGSFDMNVHFYDLRDAVSPLKMQGTQHTEFVTGI
jgi:WD40 repeat protein